MNTPWKERLLSINSFCMPLSVLGLALCGTKLWIRPSKCRLMAASSFSPSTGIFCALALPDGREILRFRHLVDAELCDKQFSA